jgi:NDP-sugar pyrophosphorylase family protein
MRAMILAAGFGSRLWPLTVDRTKPAVPFLNKPLIVYSVEYLRRFNITEMVVNLHHEGESVRHALGTGESFGTRIHYSEEAEIWGTSGALDHARHWFTDSTFVVMNGKVITDLDLSAALETHRARKALATLVLKENIKHERFSIVLLDKAGNIERFAGFPEAGSLPAEPAPLMFTGIQIMEPEIFDLIPRNRFSHSTTDVYPRAIAEGRIIAGHVGRGEWHELSTLSRYLEISLDFLRREGRDIIFGEGTTISDAASVTQSVLWQRVRICPGAHLHRVIVGDDVTIPEGAIIENSVIMRSDRCSVIERGEVVGENLIAPI